MLNTGLTSYTGPKIKIFIFCVKYLDLSLRRGVPLTLDQPFDFLHVHGFFILHLLKCNSQFCVVSDNRRTELSPGSIGQEQSGLGFP